ncbi:MAG: hypothetical protein LUE27_05000 [Clostridia bacterium]|nr:hypothetical protein [Clostridia bacterium]
MEQLIRNTTAYAIFSGDRKADRLSHSYMLQFDDDLNLREALKLFGAEFFGASEGSVLYHRIMSASFPDFRLYPDEGKKISADGVTDIIDDSYLRPVEGRKKLYAFCGFENASQIVQNKLLKTLEEPPEGSYFLLGLTSTASMLPTVRSRVKFISIPSFTEEEIYAALERAGHNDRNAYAAKHCGGNLGLAQSILKGDWYNDVAEAALAICRVTRVGDIAPVCTKYGDIKFKKELLSEMQRLYFSALKGEGPIAGVWNERALIYALERIDDASTDVRFNAYFPALLYDFMLGVASCGDAGKVLKKKS